jgi:hypothetical protein
MNPTYQTLNLGDIRQLGDEVTHRCEPPGWQLDFTCIARPRPLQFRPWSPCTLIGHPILASDLLNSKFRRPIK